MQIKYLAAWGAIGIPTTAFIAAIGIICGWSLLAVMLGCIGCESAAMFAGAVVGASD